MKHPRLGSYAGIPSGVTLYEDGNYEEVEDAYPLTHEELVFEFESKSYVIFSKNAFHISIIFFPRFGIFF